MIQGTAGMVYGRIMPKCAGKRRLGTGLEEAGSGLAIMYCRDAKLEFIASVISLLYAFHILPKNGILRIYAQCQLPFFFAQTHITP